MSLLLLGSVPGTASISCKNASDVYCLACPGGQITSAQRDLLIDADIGKEYPLMQTYVRSKLSMMGCAAVKRSHKASNCCEDPEKSLASVRDLIVATVPDLSEAQLNARDFFNKLQYLIFTMGRWSFWRAKHIIQSQYAGYWFLNQCKDSSETFTFAIQSKKLGAGVCSGGTYGNNYFGISGSDEYKASGIYQFIPRSAGV